MAWVFDHSQATLGTRLVALSVANHADKYGQDARASVKTYAAEAHLSERQARYALRTLEALGEIRRTGKHGSRADRFVFIYELAAMVDGGQYPHPVVVDGGQDSTPRGAESRTDGGHPIAPELKAEPSKPTAARRVGVDCIIEACGGDPLNATSSAYRTAGVKFAEIRRAESARAGGDIAADDPALMVEIQERASRYVRRYSGAALTPGALAAHWHELGAGRRAKREPEPVIHVAEEPKPEDLAAFADAVSADPWSQRKAAADG